MYSLSDSFALGFGTGIKITKKFTLINKFDVLVYMDSLKVWLQFVHLRNWVGLSLALELMVFL